MKKGWLLFSSLAMLANSALAAEQVYKFEAYNAYGTDPVGVVIKSNGSLSAKNIISIRIVDTQENITLFKFSGKTLRNVFELNTRGGVLTLETRSDVKAQVSSSYDRILLDSSINNQNEYSIELTINLKDLTGKLIIPDQTAGEMALDDKLRLVNPK